MELIVISSSHSNEAEPEIVTKMFEAGLTSFHLRKPRHSTNQLKQYLDQIPAHFHNRIVIHSHHDLVLKYDLRGIHFTDIHLQPGFKRWWLMRRIRLSKKNLVRTRSYKKISEVYNKEEIPYDYYFLGTIFNTLSNEFYSGYYEQGLLAALKTAGKKFIARGGINEKTILKAHALGFEGVALNSVLWKADNPLGKFIEILEHCKKNGIDIKYNTGS